MSTLILLFSILTQGSNPAVATPNTAQAPEPMRYHGVDQLLAKFEAQAFKDQGSNLDLALASR